MSDATVLRERFRYLPPEQVLRAVESALRPRFRHPAVHRLFSTVVTLWITGACDVAESQTPVLGVAVPYAVGNVVLTVLGPIIVALTYTG